ncbi:MAG TPA: YraN family protein [Candidatus Latescibacteria bacterium]|nr:YraN family protein [Candidatus Latescibacterota bacterium]
MTDGKRSTQALGLRGEEIACAYLKKKKYAIVTRRFRMFHGEIDIIARDGATLVFVEVKARADESFGRPEDAVTPGKQRQIRKIAQGYLVENPLGDAGCRFDVISILFDNDDGYRLEHFVDAF